MRALALRIPVRVVVLAFGDRTGGTVTPPLGDWLANVALKSNIPKVDLDFQSGGISINLPTA
jgi:hypothetical protein